MKGIENLITRKETVYLKRRLFAEEKDDSSNHPAQAVPLSIDFFLWISFREEYLHVSLRSEPESVMKLAIHFKVIYRNGDIFGEICQMPESGRGKMR